MIFIDAREGVSGDMLLAALLGLLDSGVKEKTIAALERASEKEAMIFHMSEVRERDETGLAIDYSSPEPAIYSGSRPEVISRLTRIQGNLGSGSKVGTEILDLIFRAEAEAHGVALEEVHLHEIGRPQALMNIAGIGFVASILEDQDAGPFRASAMTTGGGTVVVSHGAIRIPAPASAILLRDMRHRAGDAPGERATPTGIAAVKALIESQSDDVPARYVKRSIGFGTRRFAGRLGRTILLWT